jgi:hypothetical protein
MASIGPLILTITDQPPSNVFVLVSYLISATYKERPKPASVGDPRAAAAGDRDLDRAHLPPRRRQDSLGRLTPIEYETLLRAAHATDRTYPTESTKVGADPKHVPTWSSRIR